MPSTIHCPSCTRALSVPDELSGQQVQCPTCGATFVAQLGGSAPLPQPSYTPPPSSSSVPTYQQPPTHFDDEEEELRRRRRMRRDLVDKPGNVQAVNIMTLIGGIMCLVGALLYMLFMLFAGVGSLGICCLWPSWIYALVAGILVTIKGSKLMGENAQLEDPPTNAAILLIINIVNFDVISCVLGILILVFLNDPATKNWYRGANA